MVHKKPTKKLRSKTEPPERQSSSNEQQDTRIKGGGGGSDHRRKTKKVSPPPIKSSEQSPNYMKPTRSSGARKERSQVRFNPPITNDKNRTPRNSWNTSKPAAPSLIGSVMKLANSLSRNSSLRPMRSSMKKSSGMGIHPKKNLSRATCSSALKEPKIQKALDLNSEEAKSEGTPIMKVCNYTYCSLNGHNHESLLPLKSFVSARRRLIRTQTSMKLKRLSSLIAIGSMSSDQSQINPLFEEVGDEFFIEIHAKPQEKILELEDCNKCHDKVLDHSSWTVKPIHEPSLVVNLNHDMDQRSEFSNEGIDDPTFVCEYVDQYDQDVKAKEAVFGLTEGEEDLEPSFEAIGMHYPKSKTQYSECLDAVFDRETEYPDDGWSYDQGSNSVTSEGDGGEYNDAIAEHLQNPVGDPKSRHKRMMRKITEDMEGMRLFKPRAPRFLPLDLDPEDEKVYLRHLAIDGRKDAEEWMIDYALRQAVKRLAPKRNNKVELLVEAFEAVMPLHLCETPLRSIAGFAQSSTIQACN